MHDNLQWDQTRLSFSLNKRRQSKSAAQEGLTQPGR